MPAPAPVVIAVPGSKSHAIRALVASSLARGRSRIRGAPGGEDVVRVVAALRELDIRIDGEPGAGDLIVEGTAGRLAPGQRHLRLGGSGTGFRFLAAVAALRKGETILDGDRTLQRRSMEATAAALRQLGVVVQSAKGRAPLYVKGGPGSRPDSPVLVDARGSSQPVSALLLAGSALRGGLHLRLEGDPVSRPYVALTMDVLRHCGVEVRGRGADLRVADGLPGSRDHEVEGDWSTAVYPLLAGVLQRKDVLVPGMNGRSHQADRAFLRLLRDAGATARCGAEGARAGRRKPLRAFECDLRDAPDLAPAAAALAIFAQGESRISGAAHLREKESDRIAACVDAARALGVEAEVTDDGFAIRGGSPRPGTVATRSDHRMALAFHAASLALPGTAVDDPGCVAKTWPQALPAMEVLR